MLELPLWAVGVLFAFMAVLYFLVGQTANFCKKYAPELDIGPF